MNQTGIIQYHRISFESLSPFRRKASKILFKALLECIAMAGLLLSAILITLMVGL